MIGHEFKVLFSVAQYLDIGLTIAPYFNLAVDLLVALPIVPGAREFSPSALRGFLPALSEAHNMEFGRCVNLFRSAGVTE